VTARGRVHQLEQSCRCAGRVRNVLYNTLVTWQFGRIGSGYVALHNTSAERSTAVGVEPHLHSWQRNNLLVGGGAQAEAAYTRGKVMPHVDLDFNAYGVEGAPFRGTLAGKAFDTQLKMERHGLLPWRSVRGLGGG